MKRVWIALSLAFALPVGLDLVGRGIGFEMGLFWYFLPCLVVSGIYVWRSNPART
jgi:hypothetical protein